ncbi:hypothetical protein PXI95_08875 [Enterobacter asburiae]|uniref:hypothetical protein n=1 Tax=Enterobacter asburiae TaxID=61645 RepID=UPI00237F38FF|nr:hypothetical protein [Enterobacter asburiae]MDE4034183.1 hypothetical protein [Enterobacter asburiae]MDE4065695.1 hypothetical protein [Enterobacter asburiae]MDE4070644.1 hypothetical protein [Enterobacter asburiae]
MSTITRAFTKEQLIEHIKGRKEFADECAADSTLHPERREYYELTAEALRIALASIEADAVAYVDPFAFHNFSVYRAGETDNKRMGREWMWANPDAGLIPVYTAPPAPVSVPDIAGKLLDILDRHTIELGWGEKPITLAELVTSRDGDEELNACRAAMLQGAEQQNRQQNIPENIPATQFKPVADLYGLTSPTGSETSFTFDAVEARDFIDGGWSCQEYVELERFQEAITNHTEDKLAMVDHSGDSNNMVEPVTTANKLPDDFDFDRFNDVVWLEAVASNPHMHSPTTSTIAMVALELNKRLSGGNSPVIPDGWVLVPVEPTMSQEFAGYRTLTDTGKMSRLMKTRLSNIYRAMIAASPQQEA